MEFDIIAFPCGEELLEKFDEKNPPHLVILDVFREGDAEKTLKALREIGYRGKAIVSSGYIVLGEKVEDFDGTLSKPYSLEELLDTVNRVLFGEIRILLVDDNEFIREALGDSLRRMGFQVTACSSGEEAVSIGLAFDVCITDFSLGGGYDGRTLKNALIPLSIENKNAIYILMTSDPEALAGDFDRVFIKKPLIMSSLVQAIKEMVEKRAGA
ncbi:MAG: response regulator [bacterium]